jgi:hypothetical protein
MTISALSTAAALYQQQAQPTKTSPATPATASSTPAVTESSVTLSETARQLAAQPQNNSPKLTDADRPVAYIMPEIIVDEGDISM